MSIRPGDTLLAHKAINLADDLSGTERRVAGAIVDHFNRKTSQCDPAVSSMAALLGLSERTIIRATQSLNEKGYVRKTRHGGKFHRNSYEPIWARFEACEARWNTTRRQRRLHGSPTPVAPLQRQNCQSGDDIAVTQTCSNKSILETFPVVDASGPQPRKALQVRSKRTGEEDERTTPQSVASERFHVKSGSSRVAARDAAERRWNESLTRQLAAAPDVFAGIIDAIDVDLQSAATDAELRRPGSGLADLLHELDRRSRQAGGTRPTPLDQPAELPEREAD